MERIRQRGGSGKQGWRRLWPVLACLFLALGLGVSACIGDSSQNPTGYPAIPSTATPQPAPTRGGTAPTPVGADTPQGKALQGRQSNASAAAVAGAGSTGIPPVEAGAGSASSTPMTPTPTPNPSQTVTITANGTFSPNQLTIHTGQAVMFVNDDRSPQTVTDDPSLARDKRHVSMPSGAQAWDSGVLNHGQTYSQRFSVPGDYVVITMVGESQDVSCRITVQS